MWIYCITSTRSHSKNFLESASEIVKNQLPSCFGAYSAGCDRRDRAGSSKRYADGLQFARFYRAGLVHSYTLVPWFGPGGR